MTKSANKFGARDRIIGFGENALELGEHGGELKREQRRGMYKEMKARNRNDQTSIRLKDKNHRKTTNGCHEIFARKKGKSSEEESLHRPET